MRTSRTALLSILVTSCVLAACGGGSAPAITEPPGKPLAVIDFDDAAGSAAISPAVGIGFGYEVAPIDVRAVFSGLLLTPGDAGSTHVATAASDPNFGFVVAMLTNGVDDTAWTVVSDDLATGSASNTALESVRIHGGLSGLLIPDLVGHTISSIVLEIDVVEISSPGSDPNLDGVWTDYRLAGRFILRGQ